MRLVLPTRSCPTNMSLVRCMGFVPDSHALLYARRASGPRATISTGASSENKKYIMPYQPLFCIYIYIYINNMYLKLIINFSGMIETHYDNCV